MIKFFVSGKPRSTQTGTVAKVGHRRIPTRRGTGWVKECARVARDSRPDRPIKGDIDVLLIFRFARPKRLKRGQVLPPRPRRKPDVGNAEKGLLDAWQVPDAKRIKTAFRAALYDDDIQVTDITVRKRWADSRGPGVEVRITELGPEVVTEDLTA